MQCDVIVGRSLAVRTRTVITKGVLIRSKVSAFILYGKWLFWLTQCVFVVHLLHLLSSVPCCKTGYWSENSQVKQMSHVVPIIIDSSVHVHMNNSPPKASKHSAMALICDAVKSPNLRKLHFQWITDWFFFFSGHGGMGFCTSKWASPWAPTVPSYRSNIFMLTN